ncbi:MAG: hypothetical protein DRH30_00895 [Deltaproteobacteria bacterium]|nr:MAG: hypothetical protein DRH30_00895 [Deltaproteobacteria bacterium]
MSGTPTWAQLIDRLTAVTDIDKSTRAFVEGELLAKYEVLEAESAGDYGPSGNPGYTQGHRGIMSGSLSADLLQVVLIPLLMDAGKVSGSPGTANNIIRLRNDFFDYMRLDATLNRVQSRVMTYGAAAPGANTGDGDVVRLTVDEHGFDLEAVTSEQKTIICREDQTLGSRRGAELFEIHGTEPSQDNINLFIQGSALIQSMRVRHAGSGDGQSLMTNSSFDEALIVGVPADTVPGWETLIGDAGLTLNSDIFIAPPGVQDVDSFSLDSVGDFHIVQSIEDAGFTANVSTPYVLSAKIKSTGADGSLTLRMGSKSITIPDLTAIGAGWVDVIMVMNTDLWPANFYEDRMDIEVQVSGMTAGNIQIDNLIFTALDLADSSYYHMRSGQTPFQLDDEFTLGDAEGVDAKIQHMWIAAGLGYLPHDAAPTIPDPT